MREDHGLEPRAGAEPGGGVVREVLAAAEVHAPQPRARREVLPRRFCVFDFLPAKGGKGGREGNRTFFHERVDTPPVPVTLGEENGDCCVPASVSLSQPAKVTFSRSLHPARYSGAASVRFRP